MGETPRTPAPDRPPPPVPDPPLQTSLPPPLLPESAPSTPREEYHTPPPSLDEARDEALVVPQQESVNGGSGTAKSPQLSPVRLHLSPHRLLPPAPGSPAVYGEDGAAGTAPAPVRRPGRPQLHLATGRLVRTPSQGSLAMSSPSPSPTPPSPLTPAPAMAPTPKVNSKSGQTTPKHAETLKTPASPTATAIAVPFDPVEEAITSPLRIGNGKAGRLDHQRAPVTGAAENGGAAGDVPPEVAAVAAVGERRTTSVTLRVATAVLSLVAFSLMASARTSGWDGDHYGRYGQYRYAVAVNVVVCIYSIAQAFGEIRRLVSPRFIFRSTSSYYFSLFLDQVLAYLLMSASSAAASRNDLWVSRFGKDPFNKKINSAVWFSFIAFIALATNSLISTANLFSMI
ncbi:hypothetical protein E2562_012524 [Oryza meyeriana var. granulata]|uniref:CASP-like protein n=1 Tax=Oryza meyeriana var. granulata TaxID=110450 RepID=A0A6G1D2X6_9ORYZ|nr:hypothetical protein E2562_012524 [Oryza meyeriana var. granulata]